MERGKEDCHIHMVLDGENWKAAIQRHENGPDRQWVRGILEQYARTGYDYLRDGGDRWGVGAAARSLAGEYGIRYRTPLAPLYHKGHYGGFIGVGFENVREYRELVCKNREKDFVKIMISGLMDFDRFGVLTQPGLSAGEIRELVHIAHEEGYAVMAHANGAEVVRAAAEAGVDSVEHSTPWRKTAPCGCRPCPPSGTSGGRGGSTRPLWNRFWNRPWKMRRNLPLWGAWWPRAAMPGPGRSPMPPERREHCSHRPLGRMWKKSCAGAGRESGRNSENAPGGALPPGV